jgi:hypothetical protein
MIAGSLAQSNTRGVMHRVKLPVKLRENLVLLAWALVLTLVLSLILFGCMFVAAYVADELSLTAVSYPTGNTQLTGDVCCGYRGPIA